MTKAPKSAGSLTWYGSTDRGKIRANNEDSFLGLQFDSREVHRLGKIGSASFKEMDYVFAVSDGMGGALAGEYASRIAVDKITTLLPQSFHKFPPGAEPIHAEVLTALFRQVHRALAYLGACYEECAGMEATLSLCWFEAGWMYFGHIGDSRIYHLPHKATTLKQLTEDDTHVGWLFRTGQINEREARTHPRRNVLQKALGGDNQFVDPQFGAVQCSPGDLFVICTDGLTEGIHDEQLFQSLSLPGRRLVPGNPAQHLVSTAVQNNGSDNVTAMVIEVLK
jgi:protein phosphatase